MVGWAYDGPFDHVEAQNAAFGYPAELDDFSRILRAAHPDKPFVYEPRPGLLEAGR